LSDKLKILTALPHFNVILSYWTQLGKASSLPYGLLRRILSNIDKYLTIRFWILDFRFWTYYHDWKSLEVRLFLFLSSLIFINYLPMRFLLLKKSHSK